MTLTPAYGRDYKSKKEVQAAWDGNQDFVVADVFGGNAGRYINKQDATKEGLTGIMIRYKKLASITPVK